MKSGGSIINGMNIDNLLIALVDLDRLAIDDAIGEAMDGRVKNGCLQILSDNRLLALSVVV
jgi:hypothetical protein